MITGEGNRQNGEFGARWAQLMEGCGSGLFEETTSGGVGSSLAGSSVRSRRGRQGAGQACAWQQVSGTWPLTGKPARQSCHITDFHSAFPKPSFCKRYTSHCYPAPRQTRGWQLLTNCHQSRAAQDLPSDGRKENLEERVFKIAHVRNGLCAHEALPALPQRSPTRLGTARGPSASSTEPRRNVPPARLNL